MAKKNIKISYLNKRNLLLFLLLMAGLACLAAYMSPLFFKFLSIAALTGTLGSALPFVFSALIGIAAVFLLVLGTSLFRYFKHRAYPLPELSPTSIVSRTAGELKEDTATPKKAKTKYPAYLDKDQKRYLHLKGNCYLCVQDRPLSGISEIPDSYCLVLNSRSIEIKAEIHQFKPDASLLTPTRKKTEERIRLGEHDDWVYCQTATGTSYWFHADEQNDKAFILTSKGEVFYRQEDGSFKGKDDRTFSHAAGGHGVTAQLS